MIRRFGPSLLAYVCNVDEERIQALAVGKDTLTGTTGQVLDEVVATLTNLRIQAAYEGVPEALLFSHLASPRETNGRHIFNIWRTQSGGALPKFGTEDPVLGALALLAADAYPMLLVFPYLPEGEHFMGITMVIHPTFGHPSERTFEEAVLSDPDLSRLFPLPGKNAIETSSYIAMSTGRGGTLQLATLASLLIQAAYVLMRMRGQLDLDGFHSSLTQVVEMVRQAARGETFQVPVFVGYSNIAIEVSHPVALPWGRLRAYTGAGSELIPSSARPPTLGGEETLLGFVLETDYRYELKVGECSSDGGMLMNLDWPALMQEAPTSLNYQCELTALAFSLGIERQPPVACTRMWTMIFDPLSYGANISWRPSTSLPLEFYRASENDAKRVAEWATILENTEDSKIRVAQRRLLSALSERADAVDGFIDAIITWENLFGSREGELSFRISAAMATLLHDDPGMRLAAQRQIKKIYNRRSGLVHGSEELDSQQAITQRDTALEMALASLRRLYRDFPHLIGDGDRARKLVLSL